MFTHNNQFVFENLYGKFNLINRIGKKPIYERKDAEEVGRWCDYSMYLRIAFFVSILLFIFFAGRLNKAVFTAEMIFLAMIVVLHNKYQRIHPVVDKLNTIERLLSCSWETIRRNCENGESVQDQLIEECRRLTRYGITTMRSGNGDRDLNEARKFHKVIMELGIFMPSKRNDFNLLVREVEKELSQ